MLVESDYEVERNDTRVRKEDFAYDFVDATHRIRKSSQGRLRRQKRNRNQLEILPLTQWAQTAANFSRTVVGQKFFSQWLLMFSTTPENHSWNGPVNHWSFLPQHNKCLILSLTMFLLLSLPVTLLFSQWALNALLLNISITHKGSEYSESLWDVIRFQS